MQTQRGELTNNLAKLTELDNHIALEERKLNDASIDEPTRELIESRLRNLTVERVARLEAASVNREAIRRQISRVRETINKVLNEDTTLAEKIRTLFREQGVTIASLLTALGFIVSTIVLALTGGGAPVPPPSPTPPKPDSAREWIKSNLRSSEHG